MAAGIILSPFVFISQTPVKKEKYGKITTSRENGTPESSIRQEKVLSKTIPSSFCVRSKMKNLFGFVFVRKISKEVLTQKNELVILQVT